MKNKIGLLTDSTSDLSKDVLENSIIEFLPLKIVYSDEQFLDKINITPDDIYQRFSEEIPTTSMPGPDEFIEKFQQLKEKGYTHIIAIHISSGLSSTPEICKMASKEFDDLTIEVIDSKLLSMGLGRLVLYTKNLIEKGDLDFTEIVKKTRKKISDIELNFIVKTLKYLKAGGRIGKVKGTIGQILNIKPIISIDDEGQYYTKDKTRGRKKSINKLYSISKKKIDNGPCYVDVMHADAETEAKELQNRLKKLKNVKESILGEISPAMVVHAGPGLIGVTIFPAE
ncbi:MAG: DegV family protein [Bacillota bacterium]